MGYPEGRSVDGGRKRSTAIRSDNHLPTLDGVRGVAILMVMVSHLFVLRPGNAIEISLRELAELGVHGVDLFFCLSGFLITGILLDGKGARRQLRSFYARRVLRIFPLYYAVLVSSFVVLPWLMQLYPPAASKLTRFDGATGDWAWYACYLSNYAIASADRFRHGVLDVSWSLAIEEQFYVVWPAVVLLTSRRGLQWVCGCLIATALACRMAGWVAGLSPLQIHVLTPCRMDGLAYGAWVAAYLRSPGADLMRSARKARLVAGVGIVTFIAAGLTGAFRSDEPLAYTLGLTGVNVVATAALMAVVAARPGSRLHRLFTRPVLTRFGKYSYALYLFHLPVRAVIRDGFFGDAEFHALPGPPLLWQGVFFVVAGGVGFAVAALSWFAFEGPILRLKRYFPTGVGGGHAEDRCGADKCEVGVTGGSGERPRVIPESAGPDNEPKGLASVTD